MPKFLQVVVLILVLIALFLGVNMLSLRLVTGARFDATQGSMFTLTQGSRNIAKSPDEPIDLTFYFSSKLAQGQPEIEVYARRTRELLQEYARVSGGKVRLTIINPEPFSEDEDKAVQAGLVGVPMPTGENLFFGLAGRNTVDGKESIPFFDPRKERFLEYDLSRLIYSLAHPKKKTIGLITGLPLQGGFTMDPRTRQPAQTPPWAIHEEIKGLFEITRLDNPQLIPSSIDVLVIVHPKALSEQTLYAIDQFVLRGGRLLAFIDPLCENDTSGGQFSMGEDRGSNLTTLMNAWGVEMPTDKLAADDKLALRVYTGTRANPEPVPYVVWINAAEESLAKGDSITGSLKKVLLGTSGFLRSKEGAGGLTVSPLIKTTPTAMEFPVGDLGFPPQPKDVAKNFVPGTAELVLAARLTGKATTAFPDGRPKAKEGETLLPDLAEPVKESSSDVNIVLVADCDLLADTMWTSTGDFLGSRFTQKLADNGDLVIGAIDNLTGSNDLIAIRARQDSNRPFTVVEDMQRRADQKYLAEETALQAKLAETEGRLRELQAKRDDKDGALLLTPEQQAEVDGFRRQMLDTRKQLREVRRSLNADIETLGVQLKFINTLLVPALVALFALGLGLFRKTRRTAAKRTE